MSIENQSARPLNLDPLSFKSISATPSDRAYAVFDVVSFAGQTITATSLRNFFVFDFRKIEKIQSAGLIIEGFELERDFIELIYAPAALPVVTEQHGQDFSLLSYGDSNRIGPNYYGIGLWGITQTGKTLPEANVNAAWNFPVSNQSIGATVPISRYLDVQNFYAKNVIISQGEFHLCGCT